MFAADDASVPPQPARVADFLFRQMECKPPSPAVVVGVWIGPQLSSIWPKTLKQSGTRSRSFRTVAQGDLCYRRYIIAAIATKHSTYAQVMAYHAAVLCLAESSSTLTYGVYFVILYDELAREQQAARAARSDPTLGCFKVATNPAAGVVAATQTRFSSVLQQAGLSAEASAAGSPVPTGVVSPASQLTSQEQAANALYHRTQGISSALVACPAVEDLRAMSSWPSISTPEGDDDIAVCSMCRSETPPEEI